MNITVWESYVKQKNGSYVWEHNHIEDGYKDEQEAPTALFPSQATSWKNWKWKRTRAELINGKVIK